MRQLVDVIVKSFSIIEYVYPEKLINIDSTISKYTFLQKIRMHQQVCDFTWGPKELLGQAKDYS